LKNVCCPPFPRSAGHDSVDGGAGNDTIEVFGAADSFFVTRGGDGVVTLASRSLVGGETRLTSVEALYSAVDGQSYALAA
jgi:Ca2+-binding RTX toxin-like protein